MKRLIIMILLAGMAVNPILSQAKKSVEALHIDVPLNIDGVLDETCYQTGKPAIDFYQLMPHNGEPCRQKNEVWFFYDQNAIYVGAMLYDTSPDSIYNFLTQRDEIGFSDYFGVYLDPYNQGLLSYGFFITPAGVQLDMKAIKSDGDSEDESWDAVWYSKTRINEKGWVVELKIPYSALRFPETKVQTWGVNMFRNIRRYNSNNSWSHISREVSGFIDQQGEMTGISDIKPPIRLSLSPYASNYLEFKGGNEKPDYIYKGGLDLKYGINESFTLDMMLIPDFGQIPSDDATLNLSPYEIFYDEKRQFFNEGTEMFSRAGIFYSRRIGAAPKFASRASDDLRINEKIDYNPTETQLLNATKISGRTSKGIGLGVLNAMTLPSYANLVDTITGAKRKVLIQPFTNYNVSTIDKSLPNNSYFALINTNIGMSGDPFMSNVTAYDFLLKNKQKTYSLTGQGGVSYRREDSSEAGYGAGLGLNKIKGKFMFSLNQTFLGDKLDINDLGYLKRNNVSETNLTLNYNITKPHGIFNELRFRTQWTMNRAINPWVLTSNEFRFNAIAIFTNYYAIGFFPGYTTRMKDFYEPHVKGRYYMNPAVKYITAFIESDSKKPIMGEIEYTRIYISELKSYGNELITDLNLRIGQRFTMNYNLSLHNFTNDHGFVILSDNEDTIRFAKRNTCSIENVVQSSYVLNNKMGFSMRLRHYWSGADNKTFYQLADDGYLIPDPDYHENLNQNYNVFTLDMRFRWIFAPGSELSVAWKNKIFDDTSNFNRNYFDNLHDTWNLGQTNSISLKILYYIDYNSLFRKKGSI